MYKKDTINLGMLKGYTYKIWLIMRLTTVILIATMMQVSAAGFAQKISLSKSNATLATVLREIKSQSGYNFIYKDNLLKQAKPVNINVNGVEVEDVLKQIFEEQPFSYEINSKVVIVKQKEKGFFENLIARFQAIDVTGRIVDENGQPLIGASVKIKGTERVTRTGENGTFTLSNVDEDAILEISFLGYKIREVKVAKDLGNISMEISSGELEEVNVVSTGYENIPRERITGSVTVIDNKLLNRAVSPDLLSRLKGVTNGLLFDSKVGNSTGISVRGRSTINSDTKPLVVIDNFPFEGDLGTINPNDIENVTLLKDAAAASIWGVRAGNGVIVITTKKGRLNKKGSITFNSNITVGEKPDIYYQPQLSSADFIELEKFLYDKGKYVAPLRNNYQMISPVIELLSKRTATNAMTTDAQIEALKQYDVRAQVDKYFFRPSVQQQYSLNLNGGGENNTYYLSGGFDRNDPVAEANSNSRYSLLFNNTYDFFNHKLKLSTDLTFNRSTIKNENASPYGDPAFPYEQIADNNGNPLAVLRPGGELRSSYTDVAGNGQLLNWKYKPLEELKLKANTSNNESTDIRLNTGLRYKIIDPLTISANYQYYRSVGSNEILNDLNSFITRNAINQVTQINPTTGAITYPMPIGAQYNRLDLLRKANYGRLQVDLQKEFLKKHSLNAIAGYEIRSDNTEVNTLTRYGYDPETKTSIVPDNLTTFPYFYGSSSVRFSSNPITQSGTVSNNISYYANGSYVYDNRFILSGSFRKDQSNLFGVKSNQKGVPLWSAGVAWNLNNEKFYRSSFLPKLQIKASYGYSGNVNRSISAYTTAIPGPNANVFNSLFLGITNPPNPSLRWERVKNINLGASFSLINEIITGSVEFYRKDGIDLIGTSPVASQTGVLSFTGNVANTQTKGIDLELNSDNIHSTEFKWYTKLLLNLSKDKVIDYMANTGTNESVVSTGSSINPIIDYPIRSLFSYRSAGLDGFGNPQGLLGATISKDYSAMRNLKDVNQLIFHGSIVPTTFGAFQNTFAYKSIELSINISYKFGYYFRRTALNYSSLFNGNYKSNEYSDRWQNPGDENKTNVPSLIYPAVGARDEFYRFSETTAERGDHIRLQDIQMSYTFSPRIVKKIGVGSLSFYAYANNLGLIWTANKRGLDPDALGANPLPKAISLGIRTNF